MKDADGQVTISVWLVRTLAGSIIVGLTAIAGWMVVWNANDAAFKREVLIRTGIMAAQIEIIDNKLEIVPTNTEKIYGLEQRVKRLEDEKRRRVCLMSASRT